MNMTPDPTSALNQKIAGSSSVPKVDSTKRGSGLDPWFAIGAMASVASYRPLVVWAQNAWDLAAPAELFVFALALFGGQILAFIILVALGAKETGAVTGVAGTMFLLLHWESVELLPARAWLLLVIGAAVVLQFKSGARLSRTLAGLSAVILVLAPAIQTLAAHVASTEPYPIADLAPRGSVTATGIVEDMLVVVVDSYPSIRLAEAWFGHNTDELVSALSGRGLTVETSGWSHNTFTGLAIPGLLELQQIVDPGPSGNWGNRRSTFDLIRGDNLVATSLQTAGFRYTHIESGWDGAHCGTNPDVCLKAPWFNEMSWKLFETSIIRPWLLSRYGNISVPGSLQATTHLESLESQFGDGERDYVFAHLILPHAPIVVNEACQVRPDVTSGSGLLNPAEAEAESIETLGPQLACVDSLLARIVALVGDETAVLITSDHGSGSRRQILKPPDAWSDADIAERLGILLAYKVPDACEQGSTDSSIEAMRMIVSCAVDIRLPDSNGLFLIGSEDPVAVDPERMDRIKEQVEDGVIDPDAG